jgi:lipopolysaccharide export LptBFGC system permease protein LptF
MNKKTKKQSRKVKTATKVVISAIIAIVLFWISEFYLLYIGNEGYPSTFIQSWFFFWSAELAALAGIKITKVRNAPYEGDDIPEEAFE